jgi:hypothetical protein
MMDLKVWFHGGGAAAGGGARQGVLKAREVFHA